jgi:hypothetical protein
MSKSTEVMDLTLSEKGTRIKETISPLSKTSSWGVWKSNKAVTKTTVSPLHNDRISE